MFRSNSPAPAVISSDFEILVRTANGGRETVTITAEDIFAAKTRAAELFGVSYEETQILAIIDRAPQVPLAFS